jgi:hypothetical protein
VIDFDLTKSLSSSRRIPVLSRERYDRNRPSTTRLISEGDLIDLLSKVTVYIFFHFMQFSFPKRRSHRFVKADICSANFMGIDEGNRCIPVLLKRYLVTI